MRAPQAAPIESKIYRLRCGGAPRVLDLFAGCGGLSLGFQREGFEILAAIEFDPLAALSHGANFFGSAKPCELEAHSKARDITKIDPDELLAEYSIQGKVEEAVDVIIGGPPCQAFARVGRAKLREIAAHPSAFKLDPRGNLYLRFIEYIRKLKPLAVLMENVPDVINYGGHNIPEETCEVLSELGYSANYTLLNAAFYGVPQMRERMFLLAYRNELDAAVQFPEPTRYIELPRGYESSRQVALKNVEGDLFKPGTYYTAPPPTKSSLPKAFTAKDALDDLPPISAHLEGLMKRGARRFDQVVKYQKVARLGSYAQLMRSWPGFESDIGVLDHVIRYLPRDYPIFRRMKPGDQYPEAYAEANRMLLEEIEDRRGKGQFIEEGSREYKRLRKEIVPPYDPGKFPNKWRKMEPNRPARTLMAHLGKDSYSHIHYDDDQARTISVREAARLQSFPDGFVFSGTMNPAFRQIGNAVPPLLAAAVAAEMAIILKQASSSCRPSSRLNGSPLQI